MLTKNIDFEPYLARYDLALPCRVEQGESGMNNTTRIVHAGDSRYVLRIYNNHKDADIVRLEHSVLLELQSRPLPFCIPIPVPGKDGSTVTVMEGGTVAALYRYIEGERPVSAHSPHVYALGRAAAQLTRALGAIEPGREPLYSPYFELESTYAGMSPAGFLGLTDRYAELEARKDSFVMLQAERELVHALSGELALLPRQWIHGDVVFNNTVCEGDEIVGVLDFEFVAVDARAMELAVILADIIRPGDPDCTEKVERLMDGYMHSFTLSEKEKHALPVLVKLRLLDIALHFAIRLRDGLDQPSIMAGIVDHASFGCKWVNENKEVFER